MAAAFSLLSRLRSDGLTITRNGDRLNVAPRELLTEAHRIDIRAHKADMLAELDQERRRGAVTGMLEGRSDIKRAFLADPLPNGAGRVTLGLRGVGTCELAIPAGRFDGLAIIRLFDELEPQASATHISARKAVPDNVSHVAP